jgi:hypothetical protein
VTDGVDAAMEAVQSTRGETMIDRPRTQSEPEELRACDQSVLRGRDAGDRVVADQARRENSTHLVSLRSRCEMTPAIVGNATLSRGKARWVDFPR